MSVRFWWRLPTEWGGNSAGLNPAGLRPPLTIPHLAREEIKQNRATTAILAEKLVTKERLDQYVKASPPNP
ncbi:MAG: hypothetical protein H0X26_07275 [Alphaproteobacteria bacterium]|nr:hypothetical protein [Alphaproteobacteria bacterium]